MHRTWGVRKFNLYGHSSGATVAVAVAQERPDLAATVGLASPLLAIINHYWMKYNVSPKPRHFEQYNPIDHIEKLLHRIPVLIVYDPRDQVLWPYGVDPYVKEAKKRRLKIRLVRVRKESGYHFTASNLGRHLRKPKGRAYRPQR